MSETWRIGASRVAGASVWICALLCALCCVGFGRDLDGEAPAPAGAEAKAGEAGAASEVSEPDLIAGEGEAGGEATAPPEKKRINVANAELGRGASAAFGRAVSTLGALALVLGVFFLLFLVARGVSRKSFFGAKAGGGMVEVLDVARLDPKTELRTIRWQGLLILVARTPSGWVKLGERREEARDLD